MSYRSRPRLRCREFAFVALIAIFFGASLNAKEQNIFALRSAYLFYFSSLIEWPASVKFENNQLNLCVFSGSEEDRFQLGTVDEKRTGSHVLHITEISILETPIGILDSCHMLYVSGMKKSLLESAIPETTLVITEGDADIKGGIHLFTRSNKLMFEIDIDELTRKSFKASSKLLRLSRKEGSRT